MGSFLVPLGGFSGIIFEGFRGSEAHLDRSSSKMWTNLTPPCLWDKKNEEKEARRDPKIGRKCDPKNVTKKEQKIKR